MIYFITGNKNKYKEAILRVSNMEMLSIDLAEVQNIDAKVVIQEKLKEAKKAKPNCSLLVEDSALYFLEQGQGLLPGVFIKWFQKNFTLEELSASAIKLNQTKAKASCYLGYYCSKEKKNYFFEGNILGEIVSPRGDNGFGWDVMFKPDGFDKTFAELSDEEKLKISHRGRAFQKMNEHLELA